MRLRSTFMTCRCGRAAVARLPAGRAGARRRRPDPHRPGHPRPRVYLTYVDCADLFTPGTAPPVAAQPRPLHRTDGATLARVWCPQAPAPRPAPSPFDSLTCLDSTFSAPRPAAAPACPTSWTVTADTPPERRGWPRRPRSPARRRVDAGRRRRPRLRLDPGRPDHARRPRSRGGTATPAEFAATHGDGRGLVGHRLRVRRWRLQPRRRRAAPARPSTSRASRSDDLASTPTGSRPRRRRPSDHRLASPTPRAAPPATRSSSSPARRAAPGAPSAAPVLGDAGGVARVDVPVTETTEFRWHRPESQYADEGWSETVTVTVTGGRRDGSSR